MRIKHTLAAIVVGTAIVLTAPFASAGRSSYQCVVSTELHLNESGRLRPYPNPLHLGARFSVDRRNGNLVGPEGFPWTFADAVTSVHAQGNSDNSFVASYLSQARAGGVFLTVLRVVEFAPGATKPFLAMSEGSVYAGVCE